MAQVSLPDGTIIPDFPDNPTPQDVERLRQMGSQMEARMRASTLSGGLKEAGKVVGTSLADGVMGLPDLGQAGADWVAEKLHSAIRGPERAAQVSEAIRKDREQGLVSRARKAMKPETELGQRAANVGSSVTGSMLYGGLAKASPGINFTSGLLGGLGSEGLGKMSNPTGPVEQDDPFVKLVGGLGGGMGGAAVHELGKGLLSSQPYKEKIAKILMENISKRDVEGAGARMAAAEAEGIPLLAPQAFNKNTNVDSLVELASKAPLAKTRQTLQRQVDASVEKARAVASDLPGTASQPGELANRSRDKATKFFDTFKQEMQGVADNSLPDVMLETLDPKSMRQINKSLLDYVAAHPNQRIAGDLAQQMRQAMRNPEWQKELTRRQSAFARAAEEGLPKPNFGPMPNKYLDNPDKLYRALDDAAATAGIGQNTLKSADAEKLTNLHATRLRKIFTDKLRGPAEELVDEAGNAITGFPQSQHPALDAQKAQFGEILGRKGEAQRQLVGKLANASGNEMGAPSSQSLVTVFKDAKQYAPRSTRPGQGEIGKLQQQLRGAPGSEDSSLWQDSVKTWLQDAVATARTGATGQNNPNFMGNLVKQLGNPTRGGADPRWKLTKDILLANGTDRGLSTQEVQKAVHGVEKLLILAARTSQRGASPTINAATVLSEATPKALNQVGAINIMTPLRQPALWLKRIHEKEVLQTLDKWMTTREGLREMAKLSDAKTYKQINNVLTTLGQHAAKLTDNVKQFPKGDISSNVFPITSSDE